MLLMLHVWRCHSPYTQTTQTHNVAALHQRHVINPARWVSCRRPEMEPAFAARIRANETNPSSPASPDAAIQRDEVEMATCDATVAMCDKRDIQYSGTREYHVGCAKHPDVWQTTSRTHIQSLVG